MMFRSVGGFIAVQVREVAFMLGRVADWADGA